MRTVAASSVASIIKEVCRPSRRALPCPQHHQHRAQAVMQMDIIVLVECRSLPVSYIPGAQHSQRHIHTFSCIEVRATTFIQQTRPDGHPLYIQMAQHFLTIKSQLCGDGMAEGWSAIPWQTLIPGQGNEMHITMLHKVFSPGLG